MGNREHKSPEQSGSRGVHDLPYGETASHPLVPDFSSFHVLFKPGLRKEPGREMGRQKGGAPEGLTGGTK